MKIFIDYYVGNFIRLTREIQTVKNRQHLLPALSLFVTEDYFLFTTVIILIILVIFTTNKNLLFKHLTIITKPAKIIYSNDLFATEFTFLQIASLKLGSLKRIKINYLTL